MLEIRPCRSPDEELRSLEIWNAVFPRDAIGQPELESLKAQVAAWSDTLALLDGEPVGSLVLLVRHQRPDIGVAFLVVGERARRRGVGTALYRAASDWSRARGFERLEALAEDGTEGIEFARRRGFVEIERNRRVVLELAAVTPPAIDPPAGIEIVTLAERPGLVRDVYEVHANATPDIPGAEDDEVLSYERWLAHELSSPGDPYDAVFVAVADGRGVGYAKFSLNSARPEVAFHDMTAVHRDWRGRGIAGALKRAQVSWAKERGYSSLQTENEVRNTPIRKLNERMGYRPVADRVFLVGPLASAAT
jgi:GNAT superfamily N-acetyltransferase